MVKTIIGGIEVQEHLTSYSISFPSVDGGHSFMDVSGTEVQDKRGDKVILKLRLEDMPTDFAYKLAEKLQNESIRVDYTTPVPKSNLFKKTAYNADCEDADPDETDFDVTDGVKWTIDVTLESIDTASSGSL